MQVSNIQSRKFSKSDIDTDALTVIFEYYGVKNIRIFMDGSPVDHSFMMMTGLPIGFVSSSDNTVPMVEFQISDEDYKYRLRLSPTDRYSVDVKEAGEVVAKVNAFANERYYLSDFAGSVRSGIASIYVQTEDGYQFIVGVYNNIHDESQDKVNTWAENFFNSNQFFNNSIAV
jgi:hypothetical protein